MPLFKYFPMNPDDWAKEIKLLQSASSGVKKPNTALTRTLMSHSVYASPQHATTGDAHHSVPIPGHADQIWIGTDFKISLQGRDQTLASGNCRELVRLSCFVAAKHPLWASMILREELLKQDQQRRGLVGENGKSTLRDLTGSAEPVPGRVCAHCGRKEIDRSNLQLMRCSGCESVFYCNRDCQKMNWRTHWQQCKATKAARSAAK